jgi:tRNA dimethylallyltransferase
MTTHLPIVLIVGPTAGGKTQLSIDLAQRLPGGGECLCADSMQIYRGMDIGTAKPTAAERAAVPHHLLDLVDASEGGFSVDRWLELAQTAIDAVRRRGRCPIVVGGTNLYIQTFLYGLSDGPPPDAALRRRLMDKSTDELRCLLEQVDPVAAQRIHRRDTKRTIRAIEVHTLTGQPMSQQQASWTQATPRADVMVVGLDYTPQAINLRINARVGAMIQAGLLEEVRRLLAAGGLSDQAAEALGYRQIMGVLEGRRTLDDAVEEIKIRSRRLAKQQRTWLRRFAAIPGSVWLEIENLESQGLAAKALEAVEAWIPPPADTALA